VLWFVFFMQKDKAAEIHHRLCRVYGDNVMSETLNKLRRSIQNKRHGMLTKGVVLLYDNARPHTAARTNASIKLFNWEIFDHLPYSPDLAPSNYKDEGLVGTWHFHTN
jgi:hypothetical protein